MAILEKTTSAEVIKDIFPMLPHSLRTDNGLQFVSDEFEKFLTTNGIENHKTTLLWPQANTEVEDQNRSLHEWRVQIGILRMVRIPKGLQVYATKLPHPTSCCSTGN